MVVTFEVVTSEVFFFFCIHESWGEMKRESFGKEVSLSLSHCKKNFFSEVYF